MRSETLQRALRAALSTPFALACVLGPALAGAAQDDSDRTPQDTFSEIVEVRVVNLEAVVEDRSGRRVTGLKPEDFRLRVDGKELPIDYFTEISSGRVSVPEKADAVPGLEAGRPVSTSYLLFIDNLFTIERDRNRVLREIAESLDFMTPEDRMAVVAFDGDKLEMLSSWSQSTPRLREVIEEATRRKAYGAGSRFDLDNLQRDQLNEEEFQAFVDENADSGTLGGPGGGGGGNPQAGGDGPPPGPRFSTLDLGTQELVVRYYLDRYERRLTRAAKGMTAALRSFARPPGRKVMLALSGGWPHSPVQYLLNAQQPLVGLGEGGTKIFDEVFQTANLLGYTLYPVDVPGRVEVGTRIDSGGAAVNESNALPRELELHTTLRVLAAETGGRPLIDGASLASFATVVEDTRSYYWLGFVPKWKGDDKNHKIKLEVLKPGLEVRAREGYEDLSRSKEVDFRVEGALLFGDLPNSKPLRAQIGKPGKVRGGKVEVPLAIAIPMGEITMLERRGQYVAELELRVAVLDEKGERNDMPIIPVHLQGPKPAPGQQAVYETSVKLRNEDHDMVIALHDPLSGLVMATIERFVSRSR